eukprot:CAMPEP_0195518940 /NCGR_PEP_ID=MMETSP0794_2-20130614/14000_1 /TAXON_ID=515487 /ORGANISM="Stephanopyxis turris, Strain CCMP 815" /LENGTH=872 /DNA_ID=CAMNT_0040647995 /DNA_START=133 /DNA_END=2751 /DNA_ORIENTATION=+
MYSEFGFDRGLAFEQGSKEVTLNEDVSDERNLEHVEPSFTRPDFTQTNEPLGLIIKRRPAEEPEAGTIGMFSMPGMRSFSNAHIDEIGMADLSTVTGTTEEIEIALEDFADDDDVLYVENNTMVYAFVHEVHELHEYTPKEADDKVERRKLAETTPYGISMVQANQLQAHSTNPPVKICVLDTGYGLGHPDLPTDVKGWNAATGYGTWDKDMIGHGTHVAGTIGAIGNNGQGVVGTIGDPTKLDLFISKGLGDSGTGTLANMINGAIMCFQNGAKIINMSLGGPGYSQSSHDIFKILNDEGVLLIAAAGNDGTSELMYPASYPSVMSVAAVNSNMNTASFSQYNAQIEIAAPGVYVTSTASSGSYHGYGTWSGTSFASPHVAGVAAKLWSHFPECSNTQIRNVLIRSAMDLGNSGCDTTTGFGLVKAMDAYDLLKEKGCEGAGGADIEDSGVGGCLQLKQIAGTVLKDDGTINQPSDDILVTLFDDDLNTVATTRTDSSGEYRFERLPAGSYRVMVSPADGYVFVAGGNMDELTGMTDTFVLEPSTAEVRTDAVMVPAPAENQDDGAFRGGVNGDPVFLGLQGQVFKFDGSSGKWYANVATSTLQWNLRFREFETCPEGENMFVTGTGITLLHPSKVPFAQPQVAHTIAIMVADEDKFMPGCDSDSEICLGGGSLKIYVDEEEFTAPGDYPLGKMGGRVVAHNTFAACSRKWYDYVVSDEDDSRVHRAVKSKSPIEFLIEDRGEVLDRASCDEWIKDRVTDQDFFAQNGDWSTIHIETPTIKFHVEYRQSNDDCKSHILDAWISEVSPVHYEKKWQGILGETHEPKFYPNGEPVTSERSFLLDGKDDKDYEVDGPFGIKFAARKRYFRTTQS